MSRKWCAVNRNKASNVKVIGDLQGGKEMSPRTTSALKNRRIYPQLQSIDKFPKRDQEALARTIDAFLAKAP